MHVRRAELRRRLLLGRRRVPPRRYEPGVRHGRRDVQNLRRRANVPEPALRRLRARMRRQDVRPGRLRGLCGSCAEGQRCQNGQCICDAESCPDGCCASGPGNPGACRSGTNRQTCGAGGAQCAACPTGQDCFGQQCAACGPQTCSDGCCAPDGTCQSGFAIHGLRWSRRAPCASCSDQQTCQNRQCADCGQNCICTGQSICADPDAPNITCPGPSPNDLCICYVSQQAGCSAAEESSSFRHPGVPATLNANSTRLAPFASIASMFRATPVRGRSLLRHPLLHARLRRQGLRLRWLRGRLRDMRPLRALRGRRVPGLAAERRVVAQPGQRVLLRVTASPTSAPTG